MPRPDDDVGEIYNRPAFLTDDPAYKTIPALPIGLDLRTVPEWVKASLLQLGGVQPITTEMVEAAGGVLSDEPTPGEVALYRRNQTRFQTVSVIVSIAAFREIDGVASGVPYAISLLPASRRGAVSDVGVDYVAEIDLNAVLERIEPCYLGFNPFSGAYGLFGPIGGLLGDGPSAMFPDTVGLVTDLYYLQLGFDPDKLTYFDVGIGAGKPIQKYVKHRSRLMYSPFDGVAPRRVWGAESPIELFLLQALLRERLTPLLQMLLFEDGTTHPSLYDLWAEDLGAVPGFITEADMYFPDQRVAVFCDSTRHHRGARAIAKDQRISARLEAAGIKAVRVPGALIVGDLEAATRQVLDVIERAGGVAT
jgi:hypothetical protein